MFNVKISPCLSLLLTISVGLNMILLWKERTRRTPVLHTHAGFTLCVRLNFHAQEAKQDFLAHFKSPINNVEDSEPLTLSFQLMENDKEPLQLLLFERFVDKEVAYQNIHKSSKAFLKIKSLLHEKGQKGQFNMSGDSYVELTPFGFIHQAV